MTVNMLKIILLSLLILSVSCKEEHRKEDTKAVQIGELGEVTGLKYWDGEFHEFYGIPYAMAPRGPDRFKAPLPPLPWEKTLTANRGLIQCQQVYYNSDPDAELEFAGDEQCLIAHLMVPKLGEKTPVPVVVVVHSGAFAGGSATMTKYYNMAKEDVLVVAINYRLGALGFACLGTEEIPGNAALKDIVAALEWVQKYIKYFGGDPKRVTLYGYSVGATLAQLVALSPKSEGLFDKLILDSASALAPFAIDRDPVTTVKNIALQLGFNPKDDFEDLNDFLRSEEISLQGLQALSRNFFLRNSSFGFGPCIENPSKTAVLTESPLDIMEKGKYNDFSLLTGFANMEGISRTSQFENWVQEINENLQEFLPVDLIFKKQSDLDYVVRVVKEKYFNNKELNIDDDESLKAFIDYFSDTMFKYSIMKSTKLHAKKTVRPIYLYEFTYVGKLNTQHLYSDRIQGASHRDQTAYVFDFYDFTRNYTDMDMRDVMVSMWTDFIKYGNPTAFESSLLSVHWKKYKADDPSYMDLGYEFVNKQNLFEEFFEFWDHIYGVVHWNPKLPSPEDFKFPKNRLLRKDEEEGNTKKKTKEGTTEKAKETKPADDFVKPKEDPLNHAASEQKPEASKKGTVTITTDKKDTKINDKVPKEQTPPVKIEIGESNKGENPSASKIKVSDTDKSSENVKKK